MYYSQMWMMVKNLNMHGMMSRNLNIHGMIIKSMHIQMACQN